MPRPPRNFPELWRRLMSTPSATVQRFQASMAINYEKWHDGVGYDLETLKAAGPDDRLEIERLLLHRGALDWRDVEALALLETPSADQALRHGLLHGNAEIRAAVIEYAPRVVSDDERTTALVESLRTAEIYGGLTQTLRLVERHHPPAVIAALLRGVLERKSEAIHFSGMLMFLHGKAKSAFDWEQRPFYLKFATQVRSDREPLFRELCAKIGVDPAPYLKS